MFRQVNAKEAVEEVAILAKEIWQQHFTSLIGEAQVAYMLKHFQSVEAINSQINEENYEYYIVEDEAGPLGYFAYYPTTEYLYLSKLYLRIAARGKGVSKKVLSFIEEKALALGFSEIQLNVYKGNDNTISIYEKMGFEVIDEPQIDIGDGFILDDYVMRKSIL